MSAPDQPNPRAELHQHVRWSLEQWGSEHPDTEADRIINAYTHSLAEHIRDNLGGDGGFPDGMHHAADLIDPTDNPHPHCGGVHVTDANGRVVICQKDQP